MRVFERTLVFGLVGLVAAGCSDDTPTDTGPVETTEVAVDDDFFDPQTAVVSAGATVTWEWRGDRGHDVTWDAADLPSSETMLTGSHEVSVPTEPGEYGYHCTIHGAPGSGMHGTLVVE